MWMRHGAGGQAQRLRTGKRMEMINERLGSSPFFRGFGRALDIRGAMGRRRRSRRAWHASDSAALASDWNAVFRDLGTAYERVTGRGEPDAR